MDYTWHGQWLSCSLNRGWLFVITTIPPPNTKIHQRSMPATNIVHAGGLSIVMLASVFSPFRSKMRRYIPTKLCTLATLMKISSLIWQWRAIPSSQKQKSLLLESNVPAVRIETNTPKNNRIALIISTSDVQCVFLSSHSKLNNCAYSSRADIFLEIFLIHILPQMMACNIFFLKFIFWYVPNCTRLGFFLFPQRASNEQIKMLLQQSQ